jgi:hypothetical protein
MVRSGVRVGGLDGYVFGPNAEELGGSWQIDSTNSRLNYVTAFGVYQAKADPAFNGKVDLSLPRQDVVYLMDRTYQCVGIGCGYSRILQDSVWGNWAVGSPVETTTVVKNAIRPDSTIQTTTGSKPKITSAIFGEYAYTAWGIWTTENTQRAGLKGYQTTKYWIAGEATHPNNLPRTGTAQYNGEMMGTAGGRKHRSSAETRLNGSIQFDANFSTQTISGTYQVPGWASGNISNMGISKSDGKAQFKGIMQHTTTTGTGTLSGTFFGPQGEEVGGAWNSGSAGGMFRAKR